MPSWCAQLTVCYVKEKKFLDYPAKQKTTYFRQARAQLQPHPPPQLHRRCSRERGFQLLTWSRFRGKVACSHTKSSNLRLGISRT